jgi:RimJ/RimL family protein N-acetyltransferase
MDADLSLGAGLRTRVLVPDDAALLVEATRQETARSLWAARPVGPYAPHDARAALSLWDPAEQGQFSVGILREGRLLGAVGLMPDRPGSFELACWTRPEERGRGIASRAVHAITGWAHHALDAPRIWLEINPSNEPSLRLARRVGYRFEERLPGHCRDWASEDAALDSRHDCLVWTHLGERTPVESSDHGGSWHRGNHPA